VKLKTRKNRFDWLKIILPLCILLLWIVLSSINGQKHLFPSPQRIILILFDFVFGHAQASSYSGQFLSNFLQSIFRVWGGFSIALISGVVLGLLTGYYSVMKRLIDPVVHLIRMVPGIGWMPIAMIWFGVGNRATLFLISLAAFFPIYINTAGGVIGIPDRTIKTAKTLGAKGHVLFLTVILPAASKSIFTGIRIGLGTTWTYLVLGELTGVSKGLGAVLMDARMLGNTDVVIVAMITIAICGKLSDLFLLFLMEKISLIWNRVG